GAGGGAAARTRRRTSPARTPPACTPPGAPPEPCPVETRPRAPDAIAPARDPVERWRPPARATDAPYRGRALPRWLRARVAMAQAPGTQSECCVARAPRHHPGCAPAQSDDSRSAGSRRSAGGLRRDTRDPRAERHPAPTRPPPYGARHV